MPNTNTLMPIIDERRFILATRDTGYRSTAAAIAELVDNAVQAGATIIRIFIDQEGVGTERELSVAVLDNGCGMDKETLRRAMQFAGSSRFNDRSGLGRFGMGLPNSSVSQARRVDVYTWQDRSHILHTYLDVDEIADGSLTSIPVPKLKDLPDWSICHVKKRSGTLVRWSRCDRLDNRKARTIAEKLHRPLGQRFRYFLWDGNKIIINGEPVKAIDPLFLWTEPDVPSATPFGDILTLEFRVPSDPRRTSKVKVRFSELPIAECSSLPLETKRDLGIVKGAGVSVVRTGREVDYGWHLMGSKRKENYDDWWRCEIAFEPELDELFGVTHSKQDINPSELLRQELSPQLEAVAQTLNARARTAFALVRKLEQRPPSTAESKALEREPTLPPAQISSTRSTPTGVQKRVKSQIPNAGPSFSFRLRTEPLDLPDFYIWEIGPEGKILVTVNRNHAFYDEIFSKLESENSQVSRYGFECLLFALVRAEIASPGAVPVGIMDTYRRNVSDILAAYLGD